MECKITPGMELFEQQYFTEEGHEKDYTNLNFSLQNSCTPQTELMYTTNRTPVHHKQRDQILKGTIEYPRGKIS